jgi:hypothetical protein
VRELGTEKEWCLCSVIIASPNGASVGLHVREGALRIGQGLMLCAVAVSIREGKAFEVMTDTELEIELWIPSPQR